MPSALRRGFARMRPATASIILLHLTVVLLAAAAPTARTIELDPVTLTFLRCLLALPILLVVALAAGRPAGGLAWRDMDWRKMAWRSRPDAGRILALGVLLAAHWALFFTAIRFTNVAVTAIALFTYPAMTVPLEAIAERRRPSLVDLGLSLVALVGVTITCIGAVDAGPPLRQSPGGTVGFALGVVAGLGAALMMAIRNVAGRPLVQRYPGASLMTWTVIVTIVLFGPVGVPVALHTDWTLPLAVKVLAFGILFTAVGHTLLLLSLRNLKATTVSQVTTLEIVYAPLMAWIALGEPVSAEMALGGAIVAGVSLVATWRHASLTRATARLEAPT